MSDRRPLRPHQHHALNGLRASLQRGKRRPLLCLPTGGGKTDIMAYITRAYRNVGRPVLLTVPRKSLVDPTVERLALHDVITDVGVIQASHSMTDYSKPVQVATVQSLERRGIDNVPKAAVMLVDEAHEMRAFTGELIMHPEWQNIPIIGFSATPGTKALGTWYDDLGGIGSGRTSHLGAAGKCEHWRSIDLADLKRMGLLKPIVGDRIRAITWKKDHGGFDKLGIIPSARGIQFVKRDEQGKLAGVFVAYTHTPTMFGGYREWFACPRCQRPAGILYGVNALRCRRCRGLKYASQSEASHSRAQRKALSIRRRVGASGDALDGPFPPKPRKMRWATYNRLRRVDAALQEQWLLGAAGDLGRLRSRVERR